VLEPPGDPLFVIALPACLNGECRGNISDRCHALVVRVHRLTTSRRGERRTIRTRPQTTRKEFDLSDQWSRWRSAASSRSAMLKACFDTSFPATENRGPGLEGMLKHSVRRRRRRYIARAHLLWMASWPFQPEFLSLGRRLGLKLHLANRGPGGPPRRWLGPPLQAGPGPKALPPARRMAGAADLVAPAPQVALLRLANVATPSALRRVRACELGCDDPFHRHSSELRLRESWVRENCTPSLSGGRRPAREQSSAPPPTRQAKPSARLVRHSKAERRSNR